MRDFALVDVHSHFLPGLDDGCRTVEESLSVLRAAREQGVARIAATPHYYSRVSVAAFLEKRQAAIEKVLAAPGPGDDVMELTRDYLENKRSLDVFTEDWSTQMEKLDN